MSRFLAMKTAQTFFLSVGAGLTATVLAALASAFVRARFDTTLVGGLVAVALICGLAVFSGLIWRRDAQLESDIARLERASWPTWMIDIADAALAAGIGVSRAGAFVLFENPRGGQHLLQVDPAPAGLGRILERQRSLERLAEWGVPVSTGARGQLRPEVQQPVMP
jgi:hypothetical protein